MKEQQLINAFMKLLAKAGGGEIVREMILRIEENGNPKIWSQQEIEGATHFINHQTENFGKHEAMNVIKILIEKFDISENDIDDLLHTSSDSPGVQGLQ